MNSTPTFIDSEAITGYLDKHPFTPAVAIPYLSDGLIAPILSEYASGRAHLHFDSWLLFLPKGAKPPEMFRHVLRGLLIFHVYREHTGETPDYRQEPVPDRWMKYVDKYEPDFWEGDREKILSYVPGPVPTR